MCCVAVDGPTVQVWEALGNKLVTTPIAAMVLHLSVGDTWNHINNVEQRLGVAVPVVFLVVRRFSWMLRLVWTIFRHPMVDFIWFRFIVLRRIGKNKADVHHTNLSLIHI